MPPGGQGNAGVLMTEAAVRESVTVAGRVERARVAREFVGAVLSPGNRKRNRGGRIWL
jgi:hypothetical protein